MLGKEVVAEGRDWADGTHGVEHELCGSEKGDASKRVRR
jgi:hypothetical protein